MEKEGEFDSEIKNIVGKIAGESLRLEKYISRYWGENKAVEFAAKVYDIAVELESLIEKIKEDSEALEKYEYDGLSFKDKKTGKEYIAPDGIGFISEVDYFFRKRDEEVSDRLRSGDKEEVANLSRWLDFVRDLVKSRVFNWQEKKSLVTDYDTEKAGQPEQKAAVPEINELSEQEKMFFRPYEEQMAEYYREKKAREGEAESG